MNNLIAIDLDGTLLRNDKTISEYAIQIIHGYANAGNIVVFATARAPRDLASIIPDKFIDTYFICYNGAIIIKGNDIIFKKEMLRESVIDIIKKASQYNQNKICIEIDGELYSNFNASTCFDNLTYCKADLLSLYFRSAYKILLCDFNGNEDLLNSIPESCKFYVTDNGTLCQVMDVNVSKWNAIKYLLESHKISSSNVIAFGDDNNDIEMLKNSGVGVAMGNAIAEIKTIAKFITCSNEDDGVAKFLQENMQLYCYAK